MKQQRLLGSLLLAAALLLTAIGVLAFWVHWFVSGNFLLAGPISEAMNLGAISLRLGGKRLLWDSANMRITNLPEAEKYLTREYRKGWEI